MWDWPLEKKLKAAEISSFVNVSVHSLRVRFWTIWKRWKICGTLSFNPEKDEWMRGEILVTDKLSGIISSSSFWEGVREEENSSENKLFEIGVGGGEIELIDSEEEEEGEGERVGGVGGRVGVGDTKREGLEGEERGEEFEDVKEWITGWENMKKEEKERSL